MVLSVERGPRFKLLSAARSHPAPWCPTIENSDRSNSRVRCGPGGAHPLCPEPGKDVSGLGTPIVGQHDDPFSLGSRKVQAKDGAAVVLHVQSPAGRGWVG